jgi:periplasmic divalent cation tolerance protein
MTEICMLYSTFKSRDEALSVAHELLKARLIACANVLPPMTSVYRWERKMQQEEEVALLAKTAQAQAAIARIKELHSYALPCIVAWPLAQGFPPFLEWVAGETTGQKT